MKGSQAEFPIPTTLENQVQLHTPLPLYPSELQMSVNGVWIFVVIIPL